jgi:hypothetical protein
MPIGDVRQAHRQHEPQAVLLIFAYCAFAVAPGVDI